MGLARAIEQLPTVTMLFLYLLLLVAAPVLSFTTQGRGLQGRGLRGAKPHVVKHGMFPATVNKQSSQFGRRAPLNRRQTSSPTTCGSKSQLTTNAPKPNIFAGLTNDEAAAVTSFLHRQDSLNLTAAALATA